jgi:nucleoside-diphosphate-sugar epimerase
VKRGTNDHAGVDFIFHTASPVTFAVNDPQLIIRPAKLGSLVLLESAHAHAGSKLKAITVTSSVVSVYSPQTAEEDPGHVFDEKDWNTWAEGQVEKLGEKTPGGIVYAASKVGAEKAVWKFRDEKKVGILPSPFTNQQRPPHFL